MPENTKILIVEDDYTISFFTTTLLEKRGFKDIAVVTTGEEAVDLAVSMKPDLILMDILLDGDIDGIDAATEIQKKQNIPVIYMTANTDSETYGRAQKTYSKGFIRKPFMPADLFSCIEDSLNIKII